jgi:DNA-binding response OmpR family regulator
LTSLDSGVDAFLTKPVSREELRVNIRTMLRIKTAQDIMLEALERVSAAQEELLNYERQQGQYEAMQASIATCSHELAWPLSTVDITAAKMEKLLNVAETGKYEINKITRAGRVYLKEIRDALNQAGSAMQRLSEASKFTTKEFMEDSFLLDLEQAVENK